MTVGLKEMFNRNCTMRVVMYILLLSVVVSGCATISQLSGEAEKEREEKQRLERVNENFALENEQLRKEINNLKLELRKSGERESALSEEMRRLRDEKSDVETRLLSCRNHQKKLERQVADSDRQLAEIIGKEKIKWAGQEKIKSEISSRLRNFGGISIEGRGGEISVILENVVSLKSGRIKIRESAYPLLRELASVLKKCQDCKIVIEGHTDDIPTKRTYPSNWELSSARALAVLHYLEDEGIASERMSAVGYGEYVPRGSNATPEGRRKNRRVEVVIMEGS